MEKGIVFNIQRCSIHDGPGMRTLVFFKGCPLSCLWCSNPESQQLQPQVGSAISRCIGCGACACVDVCPADAIVEKDGRYEVLPDHCIHCGACVSVCYAESRQMIGTEMSVDQVMAEIEKDRLFYQKTGGGVTFSGGEALMQPAFLLALLKACKEKHIHTTLETCGFGSGSALLEATTYLDLIYFDIKHLDSDTHRELTGVANGIILNNLKQLDGLAREVIVRVPVIPGYNDAAEHIEAISELCAGLKSVSKIELLPYHNLGSSKYSAIGDDYQLKELKTPDQASVEALRTIVNRTAGRGDSYCEIVHA